MMAKYKEYEVLFCNRTNKHAQDIKEILIKIKNSKHSEDELREVLRLVHTINGSAGLMGCKSLCALAQSMEETLRAEVNRESKLDKDTIKKMIKTLEIIEKYSHDFNSLKTTDFQLISSI